MAAASATYSGGIGDKLLLAMFGGEMANVRLEPGEVLFTNEASTCRLSTRSSRRRACGSPAC
jgi:hypothetical protein